VKIMVMVELNVEPTNSASVTQTLWSDMLQAARDVCEMHGYDIKPDQWGNSEARVTAQIDY